MRPIPPRTHHKRPASLTFLDLPGEIRNKIYDLVFEAHVLVTVKHPAKHRLNNSDSSPQSHRASRIRLSNQRLYPHSTVSDARYWTRPDLLRVSHQIHDEALTYLYANTTFRFASLLTVNKFVNVAPAEGLKAVRKLELQHSTYGEPKLLVDRKWKQLHDRKWMRTCRQLSEKMINVEHLKIDLRICDWPTQLNLAAAWAKPLLLLKDKDLAEVRLTHEAFSAQRLEAASRVVSKAMMNDRGQEKIELAKGTTNINEMELHEGRTQKKAAKVITILSIKPTTAQLANRVKDRNFRKELSKAGGLIPETFHG